MASFPVQLRPATLADAAHLLACRNDPVTRQGSFSSHIVSRHEHSAWLARRIDDPACRLWLAVDDDGLAGQVRVEFLHEDRCEIHLTVAPDRRGRGYAAAILGAAADSVADEGFRGVIVARIKPENTASLAAFARAGYRGRREGAETVLTRRVGAIPDGVSPTPSPM